MIARKWTHVESGGGTRDEAIARTYDYYDAKHGKRRVPARAAFEVYRAKQDSVGNWVLWVRVRRRYAVVR